MSGYTDVFTGSPVQPTDVGYATYTLTADKELNWPSTAATGDVVARLMTIVCNGAFALTLPPANEASTGADTLITNTGSNTLTVKDNTGATITTVAPGAAKYIYLTDNSTIAGFWAAVAFGVGASNVDAAALAGFGLIAVSTTLNQACPVTTITSPVTLTASDRARLYVDTTGVVITLPSVTTVGNNYFLFIRNNSGGTTTITPVGGDLVDTGATAALNPAESVMLVSSGLAWYTVGWGRSVVFNYTQLNKNVAGGSNVTLTAAEAGFKILKFTGLLTANINVIVPATTTIWYVDNSTTGAFSLTVKTSAGTGISTTSGTHYVLYGDGTNVTNAVTVTGSFSSFTAGSAAAPSITFAADTDTGAYNPAANQFGISAGGVQVANFTPTGLALTTPLAVGQGGTGNTTGTATNIPNLTGEVTSVNTVTTVPNATVIGKVLTGFVSGAGTVAATDTILQAFNKIVGNIAAAIAGATPRTSATGSSIISAGTTAQRDASPLFGYQHANNELNRMEWWNGSSWTSMGGAGATGAGQDLAFFENDTYITTSWVLGQGAQTTCTISNATPAVITQANTYVGGEAVYFRTAGTLPTGLAINNTYFVSSTGLSSSAFQISATRGGASIATSSAGSGAHTCGKAKSACLTGSGVGTGMTVASGASVTVPSGQRLVVL